MDLSHYLHFLLDSESSVKEVKKDAGFTEIWKHVKETILSGFDGIKTILKQRRSNDRFYLQLTVFAFIGTMFTQYNFQVMYMYLRLPPLKFTMEDFSRWMGIAGIFVMLGNYVVIPFMTKKLKINDASISLIGNENK